jgi:H/ACA ribonucleoprotein complex non-core subunit NAF1
MADEDDIDIDDEEGETLNGPILSKNEVQDEKAPTIPQDFSIPKNAPIELIGKVTGLVENSVIIKANISGEFRVLKESSILCFEDRTVLGPLFEIFGRLQLPVYRVKFNTIEEFEKFKDCKDKDVFYVVPESEFLYTDSIKSIKGTDASNCHDEELPEEEQEFSDDEHEALAKQAKKKKKNSKKKDNSNERNEEVKKRFANQSPTSPSSKRFQPYGYANPQPPVSAYAPIGKPPTSTYTPLNRQQAQGVQPTNQYDQVDQSKLSNSTPFQNHIPPNFPAAPNFQNGYQSPYGIPLHQAQHLTNGNQHQVYPPPNQSYQNFNNFPYQQLYQQPNPHWNPAAAPPPPPQNFQYQPHPQPQVPPQQPNFQQLQQLQQMFANNQNQNQNQNSNQNYNPSYPPQ